MRLAPSVLRRSLALSTVVAATLALVPDAPAQACDKEKAASAQANVTASPSPAHCAGSSAASAASREACVSSCSSVSRSTTAKNKAAAKKSVRTASAAVAKKPAAPEKASPAASVALVVASRAPGMVVAIDPATGKVVAPSADQRRELSAGAESQPRAGALEAIPEPELLPDGTRLVHLDSRYAKWATVRIDASGRRVYGCAAHPERQAPAARAEEK